MDHQELYLVLKYICSSSNLYATKKKQENQHKNIDNTITNISKNINGATA